MVHAPRRSCSSKVNRSRCGGEAHPCQGELPVSSSAAEFVVPVAYRCSMNIPNAGITQEQAELLFNLTHRGVLTRIDERGRRCSDLYQWAIHPRTSEKGSPLADDDVAFAAVYPVIIPGPQAVTEHALFPVMRAVESLHTAGVLVARRKSHQQPHIAEVLQLCRVAMECAALTIWLLGDPSSEVRRERCISEEMEQLEQQRRFLLIGEEDETANSTRYPPQLLTINAEHRRKLNQLITDAKAAYTFAKTPSFTKMIRESAQWVDAHVPAHDAGEIADNGLENPARSLYSSGSSFIHGYKWMVDYGRKGAVFTMIADALAVTLNMAECAVCLLEAASRAPGSARPEGSYLPERFEPTVAAWSVELFSS